MPGRRNPPAKWVLPETINPPDRLCYRVMVPNDRQHIAAFLGAIYNLSSARFWQDDTAHTAKEVALVWQDIFDDLRTENCDNPDTLGSIEEWEEQMSICASLRVHNGKLQGLCCGVWTDIDGQVAAVGLPGQLGSGQPQPTPGGGCVSYHASLNGNSQWLLPTTVNAGDILTFSGMYGSGFDGNVVQAWNCWDGSAFFGGACIGTPLVTGAPDPAPLLAHMSLVAKIGAVWYPVNTTPLTVPGGISNGQVVIQINDNLLTDNSGGYSFDVNVCNNQPKQWCYTINFALSDGGFTQALPVGDNHVGQYVLGTGWTNTQDVNAGGVARRGVHITRTLPSAGTFTTAIMGFNYTLGITDNNADTAQGMSVGATDMGSKAFTAAIAGTGVYLNGPVVNVTGTLLQLYLFTDRKVTSTAGFSGSCAIKTITFRGTGVNPFGADNC